MAEGIVTLSGTADRRSTAQIAARLAYTVDGVVDVVVKLTWKCDDTADIRRGYVIPRDDVSQPEVVVPQRLGGRQLQAVSGAAGTAS